MNNKEFKCGYYAGKLDYLNKQSYQTLKQKSEICEEFIIGIPSHELIERITKLLYPQIAKVHNTTPSRIERAIRVAIERSWSLASMEYKKRIFGEMASVNSTRPTNMQYIQCIVNYLK